MNPPLYSDPSFQSATRSEVPHSAGHTPSVPISVYRELAAELQATKAMIDTLRTRNEQLVRQNQQLQQEVHHFVQATLQLGQFAGVAAQSPVTSEPKAAMTAPASPLAPTPEKRGPLVKAPEAAAKGSPERTAKPASAALQPLKPPALEKLYTEQPSRPTAPRKLESSPRELSGLWLAISIIFIVTTAFGAGFLIMKPLLNQR
ncbi:hypothetical protein [Almyronema epifaneia]|uniref:Uncharacterized protein n=1 Tax=Almyronema epifaneia S1 TaxID=2991925 RepID=A0ABW6IJL6_9CYAN